MSIPGVSKEEWAASMAGLMTEAKFQSIVIAAAKRDGWLIYHTHDSRRSEPGYPDLHLVHLTSGRSLFRELKTQKGRLSPAQQKWLLALRDAGHDAGVWRPIEWFNGTIPQLLAPIRLERLPATPYGFTTDPRQKGHNHA